MSRICCLCCCVLLALGTATSVRAELLGYWSADTTGGSGEILVNDQGNDALDGELVEVEYTSGGEGHTGAPTDYALDFPGFDEDFVAVPPTEELFEEITLTAWVNGIPTGDWSAMISARGNTPSPIYFGFHSSTINLTYVWNDNSSETYSWESDVAIAEDEWTFVALTITPDEATVYAGIPGGALDSNVNEIDHFAQENFTEWHFGEDNCCGAERNFMGLMDDISMWNEALSEEQLASLFDGSETPLTLAGLGGGGPALQAGDADMDLDFDQLDLVQVQIANKYLSREPATWGEGDWDGAPGGSPGSPPPGDGAFNQLDIIAALSSGVYLKGPYAALADTKNYPDGVDDNQASIIYNANTGELAVDAPLGIALTSINIDSAASIFTGDPAQNVEGSFDNDADDNIFKATFGDSFGSLSFGNVAQPGLSAGFVTSDLTVVGSLEGGGALGNVDLIYIPEPMSGILLWIGWMAAMIWPRRRRS